MLSLISTPKEMCSETNLEAFADLCNAMLAEDMKFNREAFEKNLQICLGFSKQIFSMVRRFINYC